MRLIITALLMCVLLSSAIAQTSTLKPPRHGVNITKLVVANQSGLSPEFKKAGQEAFEAINETPFIEFGDPEEQTMKVDKSMAAARRAASTSADREAYAVLLDWEFFKKWDIESDVAALGTLSRGDFECKREATLIFDPDQSRDKVRKMSKHCHEIRETADAEIAAKRKAISSSH